MTELNRDVLYLILKKLKDDKKSLFSFLFVSRTWCEIIIPILWKNPWKSLNYPYQIDQSLFGVIISHLSYETRSNLKDLDINLSTNSFKRPIFNYISFCRHLDLNNLNLISEIFNNNKNSKINDEIYKLFINDNTKFTHLYVPRKFEYPIHLIPKAKRCFSEIKFLSCNTGINDDVLVWLIEICKSVKELELFIENNDNNYNFIRLINSPNNLVKVCLLKNYPDFNYLNANNESFCEILEDSLIKHADTIQYFKITKQPITRILSSFVNLKRLELSGVTWDRLLDNIFLPSLQILEASCVPINVLISLIENSIGSLIEINTDYIFHDDNNNKRIIQAIYNKCPNLKYLKLAFKNSNISELENLLINCQNLSGICILVYLNEVFDWDNLFLILAKSSPTSLFRFRFNISFQAPIKFKSLELLFDNWERKDPMLLQFFQTEEEEKYSDLIKNHTIKGIIEKLKYCYRNSPKDFKWT